MLLTITTTHKPATDLGYLLHKHPDRIQQVSLSQGKAHIFYPQADSDRCTAALLLEIDPVGMVRNARKLSGDFSLGHYINDRPYVASSFMSVAIGKAFSSALNGQCNNKPELASAALPLEVSLAVVPSPKGGAKLIHKLFEPLGYSVTLEPHALDATIPEWGDSKYFTLTLKHHLRLQELLQHLYVLIPVLDNDKHYFVSQEEVDKLLSKGEGWLDRHPEREQIIRRYLLNLKTLTNQALERIVREEEVSEKSVKVETEAYQSLHQLRLETVAALLKEHGAERVLDLGCGEGKLIRLLLKEKQFNQIAGMDISLTELKRAKEKLHWDNMAPKQQERITLMQGSLTYRDKRWAGYDAATLVEVIEHMEPERLSAMERNLFEFAKPALVIVTTPNSEYNIRYDKLGENAFRHTDHRFEWNRQEFHQWANRLAEQYGYGVDIHPLGEEDAEVGAPSQMAIFKKL